MRRGLSAVLGCFLMVAGCAPAGQSRPAAPAVGDTASAQRPTTAPAIAAYQGPDRQQLLEEGARKEGGLTWYTSLAGPSVKGLAEGFEDRYPYVKMEVFRATTSEILTRISEETQARRQLFDVVELSAPALVTLRDANVFAPYFSPLAASYPDATREPAPGGLVLWVYDRESHLGFGYNTNAIAPSQLPRTYQDLLNPALRSKMAIAGTDTGVRLLGNMLAHQGEEFVRQLARQEVAVQMVSAQALADLIASGEVASSPTIFRDHALVAAGKGAPVQWLPLEPATTNSGGTAVSANAPHPHAAMLWADFILGEEGQRILKEFQNGSPAEDPGFARWYPEKGLTPAELERKVSQWEDVLKRDFIRR